MQFDRYKFYEGFRDWRNVITESQVTGMNFLLAELERDKAITLITEAAYLLATVFHETAATMLPIREYGRGKGRAYAKVYTHRIGDKILQVVYYGRGFVQLTWFDNYEQMNKDIPEYYPELNADFELRAKQKLDLVRFPDQALDPQIAYAVMSFGMRNGRFGARLDAHINKKKTDYINARRCVNILDKAQKIADYAKEFETILRNSLVSDFDDKKINERLDSLLSPVNPAELSAAENQQSVSANSLAEQVEGFIEQSQNEFSEITDKVESSVGEVKERTTEIIDTGNKQIEKTTEEVKSTFQPETYTQYIPQITKSKWLLGGLSFGGLFTTVSAKLADMPDWFVLLLGTLAGILLTGLVVLIIVYHKQIFSLVKSVVDKNADPAQNNIKLVSEKPE